MARFPHFSAVGGDILVVPLGDVTLQIEAEGFEGAEIELAQIAADLEDREEPLIASARILADDTQRMFDMEVDPEGDHWRPLDSEYLTNKISLGYPEDILHRTGALERAATSMDAFIITEDSIFLDTSGFPTDDEGVSYGLLHQTGSGSENAGLAANHRFSARNEEGYSDREGGAHSGQGIGRGKALPQRQFIGISEEAEGKLFELFDVWFSAVTHNEEGEVVSSGIYIKPSGQAQSRVSGRFGPKIDL